MKKLIKTIKNHKVFTSVICGVFTLSIVGVIGYQYYKMNNTYKAMEFAQDGIISSEELNQIGEIALGEEVTTPDGQKVVITQDANGNYIVTPVTPGGDTPEPTPTPTPTPTPGHTHTWLAHYTSVHHIDSHKESHTYCTKCHNLYEYRGPCNTCGVATPTTQKVIVITDREWDEPVVDYYYCSECGARQ